MLSVVMTLTGSCLSPALSGSRTLNSAHEHSVVRPAHTEKGLAGARPLSADPWPTGHRSRHGRLGYWSHGLRPLGPRCSGLGSQSHSLSSPASGPWPLSHNAMAGRPEGSDPWPLGPLSRGGLIHTLGDLWSTGPSMPLAGWLSASSMGQPDLVEATRDTRLELLWLKMRVSRGI